MKKVIMSFAQKYELSYFPKWEHFKPDRMFPTLKLDKMAS